MAHMGGAHIHLQLADVFWEGPIYACQVACYQRVGIEQEEVAYAEANELLDNCRSSTAAANDGDV